MNMCIHAYVQLRACRRWALVCMGFASLSLSPGVFVWAVPMGSAFFHLPPVATVVVVVVVIVVVVVVLVVVVVVVVAVVVVLVSFGIGIKEAIAAVGVAIVVAVVIVASIVQ